MFEIERAIMLFFQSIRIPVVNEIMKLASTAGDAGIIWLVIIAGLLVFRKTRRIGFDMLLSLAVCWCFSNLIVKPIVARPRPYTVIPGLTTLVKHPTDLSFPSGHACASFVCAYMAHRRFESRGIRAAFWVLASLITVSRIYVGVHYPTDLAAAVVIAVFGSMLVYKLNRKFIPESFLAA